MNTRVKKAGEASWEKKFLTAKAILWVVSIIASGVIGVYWTNNKNDFLEKENASYKAENTKLQGLNEKLDQKNTDLERRNSDLERGMADLVKQLQKGQADALMSQKVALDLPVLQASYEACSSELSTLKANNLVMLEAKKLSGDKSFVEDRIGRLDVLKSSPGVNIVGMSAEELPDLREERDQLQQRIMDLQVRLRCQ